MFSKIFLPLFCLLISVVAFSQNYSGEIYSDSSEPDQTYKNALMDNFTEFSPVFTSFIVQNKRWIDNGQFKQARESLTPFIDQFRARLGFASKSHVSFGLRNHDEAEIALVQKEMIGAFIKELALSNLSSSVRDKLMSAINQSLPNRYLESLFSYKRVLLLYLTAVLGEHNSYSGNDKQNFSRNIFSDFLFLVAPAIRFDTAESRRYLVVYEFEINQTTEQAGFESDLAEFVRKYSAYFAFLKTPSIPASIDQDFKRFKVFQQDVIRRTLAIKDGRKPANTEDANNPPDDNTASISESGPAETSAEEKPLIPILPSEHQTKKIYSKPTAVISQNAKGVLQFDLNSLTEIADSDISVETMVQDLKIYLTSSAMTWGQNQIQFSSSFTHSNSQIKVFIKSFPLNSKFVSALIELYYAELFNFNLFGKEALIRKNTLESRNYVYNCLVRMSLAPVAINCDALLAETSQFDENNRKKLADAYTRLLRLSRMTFEFGTESVEFLAQTASTCDRIRALQTEMLNAYKSTTNSYFPSLISLQGPAFKNASTGKREFLCQGSLNPFLQ